MGAHGAPMGPAKGRSPPAAVPQPDRRRTLAARWGPMGGPRVYSKGVAIRYVEQFLRHLKRSFLQFSDFSTNRFLSLFNRSGGPGTIKIEFSIKNYPRGLIYSFRSRNFR